MNVQINVQINDHIKTSIFDGITDVFDGKEIIRLDALGSMGIRILDRIKAMDMLNS